MVPPRPPHQRPDMGEADSLARPVLCTGAAEKVKNPLMILGVYTPANCRAISNNSKAGLGPPRTVMSPESPVLDISAHCRSGWREICSRREAVADNVRQRAIRIWASASEAGCATVETMPSISSRMSICAG